MTNGQIISLIVILIMFKLILSNPQILTLLILGALLYLVYVNINNISNIASNGLSLTENFSNLEGGDEVPYVNRGLDNIGFNIFDYFKTDKNRYVDQKKYPNYNDVIREARMPNSNYTFDQLVNNENYE